jgi:hypothetical protein
MLASTIVPAMNADTPPTMTRAQASAFRNLIGDLSGRKRTCT